jgi:hypothetical protein
MEKEEEKYVKKNELEVPFPKNLTESFNILP